MGRKRRKKVRTKPKPSLPTIFECPHCESNSIRIEINKNARTAEIRCGNKDCGHQEEVPVKSYEEPVDIYGKWLDKWMEVGEDEEVKIDEDKEVKIKEEKEKVLDEDDEDDEDYTEDDDDEYGDYEEY